MGLDMYLTKRTYVKNWSWAKPSEQYQITVTRGGQPLPLEELDPAKIRYIIQEVGYWRKANAVHRWFVEHVQDGADDCKEYYVSREDLQELLTTVNRVLAASQLVPGEICTGYTLASDGTPEPILEEGATIRDSTVAEAELPTQSGFFFGDTEYDQYYLEDLEYTQSLLEEILRQPKGNGEYFYRASW